MYRAIVTKDQGCRNQSSCPCILSLIFLQLFEYTPSIYDHQGPSIPDKTDLEQLDYLDHVCQEKPVEHAGGYSN
ncbi:unnamed protein product [Rotaria sp. Silwood2]|nr:unnamed protein product [Rotaria sp. Silwood2]